MHVIDIKNAELLTELEARLKELGVQFGAIVSVIGSVDSYALTTLAKRDATRNVLVESKWPAEMHGVGDVVNGRPHLHVTMAGEDGKPLSGHLVKATITTWFAHVYVIPA